MNLKACPFCNGVAVLDKHDYCESTERVFRGIKDEFCTAPLHLELVESYRVYGANVECTKCMVKGKSFFNRCHKSAIEEAIQFWNTRYGKRSK